MMLGVDVILAAHGAGEDSAANATVAALAQRLQRSLVGSRVTAAFRLGEPTHREALRRADGPKRLIVPLLTSDGYYANELRREAERSSRRGARAVVLAPIGTHPALTQALSRNVAAVARERGFLPESTLVVVVGHGTKRHRRSRDATRSLASAIGARTGLTPSAAFLDDEPSIETVVARLPAGSAILVVPFLLGGGSHAEVDIPSRVYTAASAAGQAVERVAVLGPLAELPALFAAIEQSVRHAVNPQPVLRAGARGSALSRRQLEIVGAKLASIGVDMSVTTIETRGDREVTTPMSDFDVDDPFTREITDAVRAGGLDVAVHSAKDLPLRDDAEIVNAAYLPRGAVEDVIVTRTGEGLALLPAGARVGTSCQRRAAQLRRLHRGVIPVSIRGDVPARVEAVDRGYVDAVVLAAAGLERLGLEGRIADRLSLRAFVPAPAQGAIVVQCRTDSPYLDLVRRIDDHDTRRAVAAELAFARAVEHDDRVAAAIAVSAHGEITLQARLIDPVTTQVWDTTLRGHDPQHVGNAAAQVLLSTRPSDVLVERAR